MSNRSVKRDTIHKPVVTLLRACGWSVFDAAKVGGGFPDLVIGKCGHTFLAELKTGNAPFTDEQKKFYANWRGAEILVFRSVEEVENWLGVK